MAPHDRRPFCARMCIFGQACMLALGCGSSAMQPPIDDDVQPAIDAGVQATPSCPDDLSNVGSGDFTVAFTLTTTYQGRLMAVLNQRGACTGTMMWDIRMATGKLSAEVDGNGIYMSLVSDRAVNDGNAHAVVLARRSGTLAFTIDGAADSSTTAATASLTALPGLVAGQDPCVGVDGTGDLEGTVTDVCVSR